MFFQMKQEWNWKMFICLLNEAAILYLHLLLLSYMTSVIEFMHTVIYTVNRRKNNETNRKGKHSRNNLIDVKNLWTIFIEFIICRYFVNTSKFYWKTESVNCELNLKIWWLLIFVSMSQEMTSYVWMHNWNAVEFVAFNSNTSN